MCWKLCPVHSFKVVLLSNGTLCSLNTQSGQNQVVSNEKEGKGTYTDVTYVNDGFRYLGSENSLVLKALHIKDFQCKFTFRTYPFDTQDCYIQLKIPERYKDHLSLIAGSVNYSVDMSMAQCILRNVSLAVNDKQASSLVIFNWKGVFIPHFYQHFSSWLCHWCLCL